MLLFRAAAALGLVPALAVACVTAVCAQPAQWPAGRQKLGWLEGRWTSGTNCARDFSEFHFTGANETGLTYTYGPPAHPAMKADVYYDGDGNIVLYFPSISFRTIVLFKDQDNRDTIDIDKSGTSSQSSYHRCAK